MSKHNKIGIKGEQIAAEYLLNKGYIVLYRNWRSGKRELDIIALQGNMVVVVEIKTRSNTRLLYPEETVTRKKQVFLRLAANDFMEGHPQYKHLRFDIISVILDGEEVKEVTHFEEAFY